MASLLGRWPWLRRLSQVLTDALMLTLALGLAYQVGFNFRPEDFSPEYYVQFLYVAPFLIVLRLAMLNTLGLYRGISRYTGLYELINLSLACLAGTLGLALFDIFAPYIHHLDHYPMHSAGHHILRVPGSVVTIDWLLAVAGTGGVRLARRLLAERLLLGHRGSGDGAPARRVLIVGAGDAGEQVARDLLRNHRDQYRPVAFADPNPALRDRRIHGLPVAGALEDIENLTARYRIEVVLIALPRPAPATLRQIVDHCRRARLQFQAIPDLDSVMSGRIQVNRLRPVEIEDLLGRPPIVLEGGEHDTYLHGRRVLVTGAGGSIGSELCRQVLNYRPAELILLGRGENSIYEIQHELVARARERGVRLEAVIGDVRDETFINPLFARLRPQVVFHAAAHKHVHFMEAQPAEAIKNNVTGTRMVATAARAAATERFILISTDKAVRPIGVMGASKRVAELIVSAMNGLGPTRFLAVRFGNVLGSRGSVIPLFRKQIAAGGPVTVTHPGVTRYFMTIPEAVSLVLEAGARGAGGEVFLLDMGQPIAIADLARNLITLSGLEPDRDIEIKFTGLRPGEKLTEDLFTDAENLARTGHSKIFRCPPVDRDWASLAPRLTELESLAAQGDPAGIYRLLGELIEDYQTADCAPPSA